MGCSYSKYKISGNTYEITIENFFLYFDKGINKQVLENIIEPNQPIILINDFWNLFKSYINNGASLSFFIPKNGELNDYCSLITAYDDVRTMDELMNNDDTCIKKHQIVNFFATLKELVEIDVGVLCFNTVRDGILEISPSYTITLSKNIGCSFICTIDSDRIYISYGSSGVKLAGDDIVNADFTKEIAHTDEYYTTYINSLIAYVNQHLLTIQKKNIPIRFIGWWRENKNFLNNFKKKLIESGFINTDILSIDEEYEQESASSSIISSTPANVFTSRNNYTNITVINY